MKINKCKLFGHKWHVAYCSGEYNGIPAKFIGAYCLRCFKGYPELIQSCKNFTKLSFASYSEKYFDNKIIGNGQGMSDSDNMVKDFIKNPFPG
jgi:hypothetical protein